MKILFLFLLSVRLMPATLPAQNAPLSATLTNPGSVTLKFDPTKKIPPIHLSCLLTSGEPRPFACEFSFDELEFHGNDGSLPGTVKLAKDQPPVTQLPFGKAIKSAAGQTGQTTNTAKAYFTRRNKPAFPVSKGYQIRACPVMVCLQSDTISTVLAGVKMPDGLFDKAIVTFDLTWLYSKKDGLMIGPHELYIENDVTTTKFPFSAQNTLRDKSEAWIDIQPLISGASSSAN